MSNPLSESESSHDHEILKKLRGLYGSCMDEKELNKRGIKPLLKVVEEIQMPLPSWT
jgi:predicted metalloendopeptidase